MIGLSIRFLAGRYHANGWDHAHNEGVPEWPPSPFRVLRALVNAAYLEELPLGDVEALLEKLRGLPCYRLPDAVDAHTRHYMPDTDDAGHKKMKVFDAFVAVDGGARDPRPVIMAWPVVLTADERSLLARLCRRVPYLGRAESWSEVSVVDAQGDDWDCWPDELAPTPHTTTLLAPSTAEDLDGWVRERSAPKRGPDLPRRLLDVLSFTGERYRKEGWSAVPGTRFARYVFKGPRFCRAVVLSNGGRALRRPTVARYAIRSAVLPRLYEALWLGERMRQAAMSRARGTSAEARGIFSGHGDAAGEHRHAMYLATSDARENRARGVIDHLVIRAKDGFDEEDRVTLQGLRRLWGKGGHDLELVLVGVGQPEDFGGTLPSRAPVLATSRVWESLTPFVPTRHPKLVRGSWVDTIEEQIARGCEQLLGVRPVRVTAFDGRRDWHLFRRRRRDGAGRRGPDRAVGACVEFGAPVRGPIALGYGAHFGLGLFVPAASGGVVPEEVRP